MELRCIVKRFKVLLLKKCPFCPCIFFGEVDYDLHLKALGNHDLEVFRRLHNRVDDGLDVEKPKKPEWLVSKYGDGYIILAVKVPEIARMCKLNGSHRDSCNLYKLSGDGKWVKMKPIRY